MSHGNPHPMNAIIGMSTIAAQSIGMMNRWKTVSPRLGFLPVLLSLINDILDMSRIESGKMLFKMKNPHGRFPERD